MLLDGSFRPKVPTIWVCELVEPLGLSPWDLGLFGVFFGGFLVRAFLGFFLGVSRFGLYAYTIFRGLEGFGV